MKTVQLPGVARINAPLGPAWQLTATVGGKRRKAQRHEDPNNPGAVEKEIRSIALQWAAEQQAAVCDHDAKTSLPDDRLHIAEKLFEQLGPVDYGALEALLSRLPRDGSTELVGLRLTDEQARAALQISFRRRTHGLRAAANTALAEISETGAPERIMRAPFHSLPEVIYLKNFHPA